MRVHIKLEFILSDSFLLYIFLLSILEHRPVWREFHNQLTISYSTPEKPHVTLYLHCWRLNFVKVLETVSVWVNKTDRLGPEVIKLFHAKLFLFFLQIG